MRAPHAAEGGGASGAWAGKTASVPVFLGEGRGLGRVRLVPGFPLPLVSGHVLQQMAEVVGKLFGQTDQILPALLRDPRVRTMLEGRGGERGKEEMRE